MGQARQKNQYAETCFNLMQTIGDTTSPRQARTEALDNLLLSFGQKLFDLEGGSTSNQFVYKKALEHQDFRVQAGLREFMDIFLGYAWKGTHPAPQSLTVALFCGLDLPALDMIGSMSDTRTTTEWVSQKLGIPKDRIDVYPTTIDPTLCYQDITSVVLDFYGAKETYQSGQVKKDSVRYAGEKPKSQDFVVLLATLRLGSDDELTEIVGRLEHGISINYDDHFDISYKIESANCTATVTPLHVGLPYSTLQRYAFHYAQEKLLDLVDNLCVDGVTPTNLGVDINIGSYEEKGVAKGSAVYADVFSRDTGKVLGQRYICQVDYAPYGMSAVLDAAIDAEIGLVRLNGIVAVQDGEPVIRH